LAVSFSACDVSLTKTCDASEIAIDDGDDALEIWTDADVALVATALATVSEMTPTVQW